MHPELQQLMKEIEEWCYDAMDSGEAESFKEAVAQAGAVWGFGILAWYNKSEESDND